MDFTGAENTFNRIIELDKDQPYGYYNIAHLHFWLFLGSKDPGEYFTFLKYSDMAMEKAQKKLEKNEDDPDINYLVGNVNLLRAMAHAMNNNVLDAFWESKNAMNSFEATLDADSTYYDAYMGLGLLDYALGYVPGMFKWAVNLSGLSSDKNRGLRYLLLSYKKGHFDKTENEFHLAKVYTDYLANYDSASIYLNRLLNKYPNDILFLYQNALTNIKARKLDRAEASLNKIIRISNKKIPVINSLAHFRKGEIYFRENDYDNAIKEYQTFVDTTKDFDYVGMANFRIALCSAFLGDTSTAKKYLVEAKSNGNPDIFEDSYAKSRSERYFDTGFTKDYLFVVKMRNYLESAKYRAVYDSLKTRYEQITDESNKAMALVYLSEASLHLAKYPAAATYLEKIDSLDYRNEKWVKPYSLYLLAMANYLVKAKKGAAEYLAEAEDNNDFEFKDNLQARMYNLKRKLAVK